MFKRILILLLLFPLGIFGDSKVLDYSNKTKENQSERTFLLDLIRDKLTADFKQEFRFVVNHLKISGDYAWFMGVAERKDGKEIKMPPEEMYDCCHVEVLYQKQNGKWQIVDYQPFSMDVWYENISKRYPKANPNIFK
ncbi:MAG: hypothetical protein O9301_01840 [Leptospira sp.]|nr:hypothetical protein [Leptospira sp.]